MNEEQGKPKGKWYKKIIIIAIFLSLLIVITFFILQAVGKVYYEVEDPYSRTRKDIQQGIVYYAKNHNESLPTLTGTYTNANCSNCSVINVSALLIVNGGLWKTLPTGLYLSGAADMDNCNNNSSLGCSASNHYIWIVDNKGTVFSYCTGAGCETNNSGYQGVWP